MKLDGINIIGVDSDIKNGIETYTAETDTRQKLIIQINGQNVIITGQYKCAIYHFEKLSMDLESLASCQLWQLAENCVSSPVGNGFSVWSSELLYKEISNIIDVDALEHGYQTLEDACENKYMFVAFLFGNFGPLENDIENYFEMGMNSILNLANSIHSDCKRHFEVIKFIYDLQEVVDEGR